jgi:hypothetical protein
MAETTTLSRIHQLWPQTPLTGPSPREIPNTDRWHSLTQLFHHLDLRVGVEVGTERAIFAKRICVTNPQMKLYCVDPWTAYKGYREHVSQGKLDDFYAEAKWRMASFNAALVRKFSVEAASDFKDESLDMVYIDGNHNLLNVIQDLWHWTPKVKSGFLVCGHDYIKRKNTRYQMHVIEAVNAYVSAFGIDPLLVLGRKESIHGELREKPRSWMFVKP